MAEEKILKTLQMPKALYDELTADMQRLSFTNESEYIRTALREKLERGKNGVQL